MDYNALFKKYKQISLYGRYITLSQIEPLLKNIGGWATVEIAGQSVQSRPIWKVTAGRGKIKVLLWSQMHGNESTATKALFDFFNILENEKELRADFLNRFTFVFLPMLNPDGAARYTRENGNQVDLNRDFSEFSQPESTILRSVFEEFQPDYCYNLHDQRTIFGAGSTGKPATISFLAPAFNEKREWSRQRLQAIKIINAMNAVLQTEIPGQIGRFDDTYNANCAGDTFQLGAATILIEAGHFPNDYQREITRKHFLTALLSGIDSVNENDIVTNGIDEYLNIPQNMVVFYDFVYKNIRISYDGNEIITNFAAQYTEELTSAGVALNAEISAIGNLESFYGHCEFDGDGDLFHNQNETVPMIGAKADFYIGKTEFINGVPI